MSKWLVTTCSGLYDESGQLTEAGKKQAGMLGACILEQIHTCCVIVLYAPCATVRHRAAEETARIIGKTFGIPEREVAPLPDQIGGPDQLPELAEWILRRAEEKHKEAAVVVTSMSAAPALIHDASGKMLGQYFRVREVLHRGQAHVLDMIGDGAYRFLNPSVQARASNAAGL